MADDYFNDEDYYLTENLKLEINRHAARKLDRYFGDRIGDINRDWERDMRRIYEQKFSKGGKGDQELEERKTYKKGVDYPKPTPMPPHGSRSRRSYYGEKKSYGGYTNYGGYGGRQDYVSMQRVKSKLGEDYWNDLTKDLFGWSIKDKIKQMKPFERYWPVVQEVGKSKELNDMKEYAEEWFKDP
jgi:hypothetical protein